MDFWWIISVFEVLSFWICILLWQRSVDATGVIQTTEVKWINILCIGISISNSILDTNRMANY